MKRIRIFSVLMVLILVILIAGSCEQIKGLTDILGSAQNDADLTGDDYIVYRNGERSNVMSEYVGTKVAEKQAELLLDNVELTYYEVEGEPNKYELDIDNANKSYFFNGVVRLKGASEEILINVRMLAPEWYEYFTIDLKGDPADYEYFVEGNMYEWKKELLIDYEYWFDYEGLNDYEDMLIIDESEITKVIATDFAKYLYEMDTIYNYSDSFTYYLTTEADFVPGNKDTMYRIFVDTEKQEAVITVTEEGKEPVEEKLTFSK